MDKKLKDIEVNDVLSSADNASSVNEESKALITPEEASETKSVQVKDNNLKDRYYELFDKNKQKSIKQKNKERRGLIKPKATL